MYIPRGTQSYFGKAVYISSGDVNTQDQTTSGAIQQLNRIVDVGFTVNFPVQFESYLVGNYDPFLTQNNSVDVHIKWLETNAYNESLIGLAAYLPPSGQMGFNLEQEKSIYISVENTQGIDAVGATGYSQTKSVIGLAQALLTQYQLSATVGGMIEAEASFNCLSAFVYSGQSGFQTPAVHHQSGNQITGLFTLPPASADYNALSTGIPTGQNYNDVAAISANDMILMFPVGTPFGVVFTGYQSCYLQSFNCSIEVPRQELKPLGYAFAPHRAINYPMHVNLTTEAIVSSYQMDQLERISCLGTGQSVYLVVKQPCSSATLFVLYFNDIQLESQDFITTIGRNDVVSIKWRGIIGNPYQYFFDPTVNYIVDSNGNPWGQHW